MDNFITKPIKIEEVGELVRQNSPWDKEKKIKEWIIQGKYTKKLSYLCFIYKK